jgi:hypothetical protein
VSSGERNGGGPRRAQAPGDIEGEGGRIERDSFSKVWNIDVDEQIHLSTSATSIVAEKYGGGQRQSGGRHPLRLQLGHGTFAVACASLHG